MAAISRHPSPKTRQDIINILGDQTDDEFRVFQEIANDDVVKTIAVGECDVFYLSHPTDLFIASQLAFFFSLLLFLFLLY